MWIVIICQTFNQLGLSFELKISCWRENGSQNQHRERQRNYRATHKKVGGPTIEGRRVVQIGAAETFHRS